MSMQTRRDFLRASAAAAGLLCLPESPDPTSDLKVAISDPEWSIALHFADQPGNEVLRLWRTSRRGRVLYSEFELAEEGLTLSGVEETLCNIFHGNLDRDDVNELVLIMGNNLVKNDPAVLGDLFVLGGGKSRFGKKFFHCGYVKATMPPRDPTKAEYWGSGGLAFAPWNVPSSGML